MADDLLSESVLTPPPHHPTTPPLPLVLVVGAGINGAAVARELVLNGISVVVVDANDIAFGATSRSSRLIHGGLRYLERGDIALVRESLRERAILLRTAPDFVRPLRLRIPVRRRCGGLVWSVLTFFGWDRSWLGRFWLRCFPNARERGLWLIRLGLWMYDRLAAQFPVPHRTDGTDGTDRFPGPAAFDSQYRWQCEYFDAQILSPERFTVALLNDARQLAQEPHHSDKSYTSHRSYKSHQLDPSAVKGSHPHFDVHTHTLAEFHGREVRLIDRLGRNPPITLRPDVVINATGAWGDATLADWRVGSPKLFGGTKGSHFVTANRALRAALGDDGIYAEASDGRLVFVLPFGAEQTLVGTTDEPFDARPETAAAEPREIDYLIDLVNAVMPAVRLTREEVVMSYSGVRPLPFDRADSPSSIPRGHWIDENTRGPLPILTLIGGKLTTCRALAEEVCDRVLARLRLPRIASSRERMLPEDRALSTRYSVLSTPTSELDTKHAELRTPYSVPSTQLSASSTSSDDPVVEGVGGHAVLDTIRSIIRHEWVRTLSDLVERRLLLIFDPTIDQPRLRELASLLADEGVIRPDQIDSEVAATTARLHQVYGIPWDDS